MSYSCLIGFTVLVIVFVAYEFTIGYKCYFNKEKGDLKYGLFRSEKSIESISKTELQTIGKFHVAIGVFFSTLIENSVALIFLSSCCSTFYLTSKLGTFIMDVYYLDFILFVYIISLLDKIKKNTELNKGQIK